MGRFPKFDTDAMLDAARTLLLSRGPVGVTVQGIAASLGAPSGSIYYRFANRDALAAELWLRTVDRFQVGLLAAARDPDPVEAAVRSAHHVLEWSRTHSEDARVLVLYRTTDLVPDAWPPSLVVRNDDQLARVHTFLADLCTRLGAVDHAARRRVRFAVIDVPYAAVRPALLRGDAPEPELDELVEATVRTTVRGLV